MTLEHNEQDPSIRGYVDGHPIRHRNDIWAPIRAYWSDEVATLAATDEPTIINGPHGTGKTQFLGGPLVTRTRAEGGRAIMVDTFSPRDVNTALKLTIPWQIEATSKLDKQGILDNEPSDAKRLLVLDEIGVFGDADPNVLQEFLGSLQSKKIRPVFINAAATVEERIKINTIIQNSATPIGMNFKLHEIQRQHIPVEVVEQVLDIYNADPSLTFFFTHPANKYMLRALPFGMLFDYGFPERIRNLNDLKLKVTESLRRASHGLGKQYIELMIGNKEELKEAFTNLGVLEMARFDLDKAPDFG